MIPLTVDQIVIDSRHPEESARFWGALTGSPWGTRPDGWAWVEATPRLSFQPVPEPKTGKSPVHLDLRTTDPDRAADQAVGLGATVLNSFHDDQGYVIVIADPEGLEFCLTCPAGLAED